jgi:hypothetical protein
VVTLIVVATLYVLAFAMFRWLGGLGAAGDVFRRWGRSHSSIRAHPGSSS